MGYSIAIHCKNKTAQEKMKKFMEKNFKSFIDLVKDSPEFSKYPTNYPEMNSAPHSDLAYDKNKLALGFNYNCSEIEDSYYRHKILSWMTLKVGKELKFKDKNLPLIWYDGDEKMPLYLTKEDFKQTDDASKKYTVDNLGWSKLESNFKEENFGGKVKYLLFSKKQKKLSKLVKAELQRLENLWTNL